MHTSSHLWYGIMLCEHSSSVFVFIEMIYWGTERLYGLKMLSEKVSHPILYTMIALSKADHTWYVILAILEKK